MPTLRPCYVMGCEAAIIYTYHHSTQKMTLNLLTTRQRRHTNYSLYSSAFSMLAAILLVEIVKDAQRGLTREIHV